MFIRVGQRQLGAQFLESHFIAETPCGIAVKTVCRAALYAFQSVQQLLRGVRISNQFFNKSRVAVRDFRESRFFQIILFKAVQITD